MPAIFQNTNALAKLRNLADRGDEQAQALMALFNSTYYVALSAGAEGTPIANTIRISGQVKDQDGQNVAGVKDILVTSVPIAGAGTMIAVASEGTLKAGSVSKEVWVQTKADGSFKLDVLNATAEDNLIVAQLDNGTVEMLKLTYA